MLMCLIMPMLYSKIKFDIDVNNDNLLETIWEHMKQRKGGRYYYIDKPPFPLFLFLSFSSHSQSGTSIEI